MQRITMIGDVGWSRFYHLGDEAMTEFALEALAERTDVEITLIAGEPDYASEMYGINTIARIGFDRDRPPNIARMARVLAHAEALRRGSADPGTEAAGDSVSAAEANAGSTDGIDGPSPLGPTDPALAVIDAVRGCDAVLINGGGNLNSMFAHHIYERATLARLAQIFGKPYALTSQTLGPLIHKADRGLVHDLLSGAAFVGTRESFTTALAQEIGGGRARVHRQVDDAFSLTARDEDRTAIADLVVEPFILASFAEKASSPKLSDGDYRRSLVDLCRRLAEVSGLRILLVPHGGALPPADPVRDQIADAQIADAVGSDRVMATRMLTARQLVALTERAELVIGTRYHAGIFAGAAAVPFISVAPNHYSSIRMRGAAENVGMEDFVLPLESVDDIVDSAQAVLRQRDSLRSSLRRHSDARRSEHRRWWDYAVARLSGDPEAGGPETRDPEAGGLVVPGFFHARELTNSGPANIGVVRERLGAIEEYGLLIAEREHWFHNARTEARIARSELENLQARLDRAERRLERQERHPVVRAGRRLLMVGRRVRRGAGRTR